MPTKNVSFDDTRCQLVDIAEIKRLRETNKALLVSCKVLVAQLEDSLAGVHDDTGRVFIPGKTDLQLRADGTFLLSHVRAAILKADAKLGN